jgi:predicted DNA-binding protein with PD1-like motif
MQYSEARYGRVFILRLQDGEVVHEVIEQFARDHGVERAAVILLGGADERSALIVGPEEGRSQHVRPMEHVLDAVHEAAGTGTIFPDEEGNPFLHLHAACGRGVSTVTGCVRRGVKVWHIMEVILFELTDTAAIRKTDPGLGFKLLAP